MRGRKKPRSTGTPPPTAGEPFPRGGSREWGQKLPQGEEEKGKEVSCLDLARAAILVMLMRVVSVKR